MAGLQGSAAFCIGLLVILGAITGRYCSLLGFALGPVSIFGYQDNPLPNLINRCQPYYRRPFWLA
jgi:hypothetical protein